jgi:hypothetical protein
MFCCVQGLAAQVLLRRLFLRTSAFLHLAAFCLFVSVYFPEPKLTTPGAIAATHNQGYLEWSPSYWFFGLFQQLHRADPGFDRGEPRVLKGERLTISPVMSQ